MKPMAIVYTSNTGHTEQYAKLLGSRTGLPVYALQDGKKQLPNKTPVIYLGWIHAGRVKGYSEAAKYFSICAVCGVGLCDTGTQLAEVRKATAIPEQVQLYTLQGGIDRGSLKGLDKLMIRMLIQGLAGQKQRSEQEERMLQLLQKDASYVREENLASVLEWYREENP